MKGTSKKNPGFTIIEVMVAVVIISAGLIGALTLSSASINFGRTSLNRVVAANLAQEGIEVIRSIRDNIWLSGDDNPWDNSPFDENNDGIVFWDTFLNTWTWDDTNSGYWSGARLYSDSDGRYIQYGSSSPSGTPTNFWRSIEISAATDSDGNPFRRVVSKVKWEQGGKFYEVQAEDWLYNWR